MSIEKHLNDSLRELQRQPQMRQDSNPSHDSESLLSKLQASLADLSEEQEARETLENQVEGLAKQVRTLSAQVVGLTELLTSFAKALDASSNEIELMDNLRVTVPPETMSATTSPAADKGHDFDPRGVQNEFSVSQPELESAIIKEMQIQGFEHSEMAVIFQFWALSFPPESPLSQSVAEFACSSAYRKDARDLVEVLRGIPSPPLVRADALFLADKIEGRL